MTAVALVATTGPLVPAAAGEAPTDPAAATPAVAAGATLAWQDCGDGFECATALVPLDHDEPRAAQVELALIRLPARDPDRRIGSLFTNPGGPGGSGVGFVRLAARAAYAPEVLDRFDVVGVDPRGVGASTAVRCFADTAEQTEFLLDLGVFPDDRVEERSFLAETADYVDGCAARSDELLQHTSTANVARDLDLLRRAVGDERLTYAGYSYGTYLGATYAALFPDRVRALVLDAVVDPDAYAGTATPPRTSAFVRQGSASGSAETLEEFFRLCTAAGEGCALTAEGGDPEQRFAELTARLRGAPIPFPLPDGTTYHYGYDDVVAETVASLYAPAAWALLSEGLQLLWEGTSPVHGAQLVAAAARSAGAEPGGADPVDPYLNAADARNASVCVDTDHPRRGLALGAAARSADEATPYVGSYWTWVTAPCATWPARDADRYTGPFDGPTGTPPLVVGTRFDPATPYRNAVAYADDVPGARLLTVAGWGHAALALSACADAAVAGYLVSGVAPPADITCATDVVPFAPTVGVQSAGAAAGRGLPGAPRP